MASNFVLAEDHGSIIADRVIQLDSRQFAKRQAAFRSLFQMGTDSDPAVSLHAKSAIQTALQHPSLEVRLAAGELLDQIQTAHHDATIRRLRDPSLLATEIQTPEWLRFMQHGGQDMLARRFFARLMERFPIAMTGLRIGENDPLALPRQDILGWGLAVWTDLEQKKRTAKTSQLGLLLSQPNLGPSGASSAEETVLFRLIHRWLEETPTRLVPISRKLRIALRYRQSSLANQLIDEVFADSRAWPESRVAALLSACVLERPDTIALASRCLDDHRTGCVWNLMAADKRRIRTQVRDVALVVLLQTRDIDPRSAGFEYVEADSLFIFRDHSLGFADEPARELAHKQANHILRQSTRNELAE